MPGHTVPSLSLPQNLDRIGTELTPFSDLTNSCVKGFWLVGWLGVLFAWFSVPAFLPLDVGTRARGLLSQKPTGVYTLIALSSNSLSSQFITSFFSQCVREGEQRGVSYQFIISVLFSFPSVYCFETQRSQQGSFFPSNLSCHISSLCQRSPPTVSLLNEEEE